LPSHVNHKGAQERMYPPPLNVLLKKESFSLHQHIS